MKNKNHYLFFGLFTLMLYFCGGCKDEVQSKEEGPKPTTDTVAVMDESEIPNFDKYYKPAEFAGIDMLRSDAKWSWFRSKQSEHFFVFWEAGFGDDPNAESVPANLRVDVDDLLAKAEQFYQTNVEKLKFVDTGQGKSFLDRYKMEIYLLYQEEWLATGSGYDNTIGALWVNPSTCQPVGSTIAHEIGHSFQYQVYCDKLCQGGKDDMQSGFRYGYEGSNGGNGFWEQCAQWQSFQDYPEEMFTSYNFDVWLKNNHRHFENEWMRYASYWLQSYWVMKHGIETIGQIWRESVYPEDAISAYTRLYCGGDWNRTKEELYDYASRMATFDIDGVREYSDGYLGRYHTTFYPNGDYYQVAYANCPEATGFNVIPLNVPEGNTVVTADFVGLEPGAALAAGDPGEYMESEAVKGTTTRYNAVGSAGNMGWMYGFVALKQDGSREYGKPNVEKDGQVSFTVPAGTKSLYFIVQAAPQAYVIHPWDEKEVTDTQFPYKVKFEHTDLLGHVTIDPDAEPQNLTLTYDVSFAASATDYNGTSVRIADNGDLVKVAQALTMQPSEVTACMLAAKSGAQEGKIAFAAVKPDGSLDYNTTANGYGFWFDSLGNSIGWSSDNDSKVYVEYDAENFTFSVGQYPGKSVAGDSYTVKEALVYTEDGKQYRVTFVFNIHIK